MMLIVDSGSTTTDWVFVNNGEYTRFKSPGFNPYYYKNEEYLDFLNDKQLAGIRFSKVEEIFFYGSGCSTAENCAIVKSALWEMFPNAMLHLHHDLYGAALALCGNNTGIACILGTGSNSCLWNGIEIVENVPSLGYLLADEGSGTYLGKIILAEILIGNAPNEIAEAFYDTYKLNFATTLDKIYKEGNPNKFFSQLSHFANDNINNDWIVSMIGKNFEDFLRTQIMKYSNYENHKINFVGSVSYHFKDILIDILKKHSLNTGKIIKSPIEELVRMHV
jgi:N-acetylglucosamine kinase-like BadF-type ATPase